MCMPRSETSEQVIIEHRRRDLNNILTRGSIEGIDSVLNRPSTMETEL